LRICFQPQADPLVDIRCKPGDIRYIITDMNSGAQRQGMLAG